MDLHNWVLAQLVTEASCLEVKVDGSFMNKKSVPETHMGNEQKTLVV